MSSRVSTPPWNIDLITFNLGPPRIFYLLAPVHPPPPPLEMYLRPKKQTHFFQETDFIFNNEITFERWNINMHLQSLRIKGELGFF